MWDPSVGSASARGRVLNAVALQNAVLCAECDVVSDSPHDECLVCGSRSLFNISRMLGGNLPRERASLVAQQSVETSPCEDVLEFPNPHRARRRAAGSLHLATVANDHEIDEQDRAMLVGQQGR